MTRRAAGPLSTFAGRPGRGGGRDWPAVALNSSAAEPPGRLSGASTPRQARPGAGGRLRL